MNAMDQTHDVLNLIVTIEGTLSRLYRGYAEHLPAQAAFWLRLAEDELRHQGWAAELIEMHEQGLLVVRASRANLEVYRDFLHFLECEIARIQHESAFTAFDALTTARDAERTYIERNLLSVMQTDSEGVQRVLTALGRGTEQHEKIIIAEWEKASKQLTSSRPTI